ncbi:MAG: hypothetical protein JNL51_05595 [Chitinophagaceae bacterium]|nr:hypothetical protein [Chitinophagaceae bacterium]
MKFTVTILLTALSGFVCGLYLPWWSVGVAAFLAAVMIYQPPAKAFLTGALGIFLLWGVLSWIIDSQNQGLLSAKIARILPLGGSSFLLILLTSFIGSLVGGLGALSGSLLRRI